MDVNVWANIEMNPITMQLTSIGKILISCTHILVFIIFFAYKQLIHM